MQAISLSSTSGSDILVSCHFVQNSPAQGCLVEFTCTQNGLQHLVQLHKTSPTESIGTATVPSLEPCFYSIAAFDVEANGSVSQFAAISDSLLVTGSPDTFLETSSPNTIGEFFTHS